MSFENAIVLGMIDVLAGNFGCALMALGHPVPAPSPGGRREYIPSPSGRGLGRGRCET